MKPKVLLLFLKCLTAQRFNLTKFNNKMSLGQSEYASGPPTWYNYLTEPNDNSFIYGIELSIGTPP